MRHTVLCYKVRYAASELAAYLAANFYGSLTFSPFKNCVIQQPLLFPQ